MGILNGLRGGEAIYLTAPMLQYEKLQRPEEIRLPAGGGRQASSGTNKDPELFKYLPGNSNALSIQKRVIDHLSQKMADGEASEKELQQYEVLKASWEYNIARAQLNLDNYNLNYNTEEYRTRMNQIYLDPETGNPVKSENGQFLKLDDVVQARANATEFDEIYRIPAFQMNNIKYSAKDWHNEMDRIYKETEGKVTSASLTGINVASGFGSQRDKDIFQDVKRRFGDNHNAITNAAESIIKRTFSDKQLYLSAKDSFYTSMESGSAFIKQSLLSEKDAEERLKKWRENGAGKEIEKDGKKITDNSVREHEVVIKGKKQKVYEFAATEKDFVPYVIQEANREGGRFTQSDFDIMSNWRVMDDGTGSGGSNGGDISRPLAFMTRDESSKLFEKDGFVDLGYMVKNYTNTNDPIIKKNPELANIIGSTMQRITHSIHSNGKASNGMNLREVAINNFLIDNPNLKRGNLSDEQIQIAIDNLANDMLIDELSRNETFRKSVTKGNSGGLKFESVGDVANAALGAAILAKNPSYAAPLLGYWLGNDRQISSVKSVSGALAGMKFSDIVRYGQNIKTYKIVKDDLAGTSRESGFAPLASGTSDRVAILGTTQNIDKKDFGGKEPFFVIGTDYVSNVPMDGEPTFAMNGYVAIPAKKKYLEKIRVNAKDEDGKDINLSDYDIEGLDIKVTKVTKEMAEANPYAGYNVGDDVYLVPGHLASNTWAAESENMIGLKNQEKLKARLDTRAEEQKKASESAVSIAE